MRLALFMIILAVVSALVAAAGDRMGHRAARRKVRLGKLRPRDVSTIIAITTGVLISLATCGVGLLLSRDFRDSLLHFDALKAKSKQLEQKNEQLASDNQKVEEQLKAQNAQLVGLQSDLTAITSQKEQLNTELDKSQGLLKETSGRLFDREAVLRKQEKKIRSNEARIKDQQQQADIWGRYAEAKVKQQDTANQSAQRRVLLTKGDPLYYGPVSGAESANLTSIVQARISEIQVRLLNNMNVQVSPGSSQAAEDFIKGYSLAGMDAMLVIFSATNVFEGDDVQLAFDAQALTPLVHAGDVVLDVRVGGQSAAISAFGGAPRSTAIPPDFDRDSFTNFVVELQDALLNAAIERGFLPQMNSNELPTPVLKLVDTADALLAKARPYSIQFVAKRDLNALDGLEDCEIHITSLPQAPAPASGGGETAGGGQ